MNDIDKYAKENVMKIVVGNKKDLTEKRQVSTEEAKDFTSKNGLQYIETSAKDSSNIQDLFLSTTKSFIDNMYNNSMKKTTNTFTPGVSLLSSQPNVNAKKDSECCS